jgi:hypothetical protein
VERLRDGHASVEKYLDDIGVPDETVDALRASLLEP